MLKPIQASIRAIPPTGVTGDIPVYREDRDQRIGNASFDPTTNMVDIEITDPEMSAFFQQGILKDLSIGSIAIESD